MYGTKNRLLSGTIRRLLAGSIGVGATVLGVTSPALAQDAALGEIFVTGTRITAPGVVSSSPITSIGAAEISLQQQPEVERILRLMPMIQPGDGQNVNNGTVGTATISLRGMGTQRNLIMIDGKRLTPYGVAGVVDLAQIPQGLVERIDIITGGGSAVYGSDAISGALNFILKRDFEGVEITSNMSQTEQSDGRTTFVSALLGGNFADGRGNMVMNLHYTDRDSVLFGARPLGQLGIVTADGGGYSNFLAGTAPTAPPEGCGGPGSVATGGSTTTLPTRLSIPGAPTAVLGQFREDGSLGPNCSVFNFNPWNYYQTPQQRYGGSVSGRFELNDSAEAYGRFAYTSTNVTQQIAPSGVFGNTFWTPLANPFISSAARATILDSANAARIAVGSIGASNWRDLNTNGVVDAADDLLISYRRRTVEFGARSSNYDSTYYSFVMGLRGTVMDDWNYDVSFQRGESQRADVSAGYTNVANIAHALNAVSTTTCRTGGSGCVPLNLFGGFGTITPAMAGYSSATAFRIESYSQQVAQATLSGQFDAAKTPWADRSLAVSIGTEYREEAGQSNPDECLKLPPTSCLGGAGGNQLPINGGFDVFEVFGEAILPLVSGRTGVESLDLELGYRWSDYSLTGNNRTWKAGLSWKPTDQLLVRAMKQKAVRAPTVGEAFAPQTTGLDNADLDPCSITNFANNRPGTTLHTRCLSTGMTPSQVGAIEDLVSGQINMRFGSDPLNPPKPESADTITIGVVWTPDFFSEKITRPTFSIDYYDIDIEDVIGEFGAQEILDSCYKAGIVSECAKVNRLGGDLVLPGSGLSAFTTNLKYLRAEGVELGASFGVEMGGYGDLSISANVNHYLIAERQSSNFSDLIKCVGMYGTQCGNPRPETRWIQRTMWNFSDYSLGYMWRHTDSTSIEPAQYAAPNQVFPAFRTIDSYDYFDLFAGWQVNDKLRLSFNVSNIFDKEPPVLGNEAGPTSSNSGNTFPSVFDPLGRVFTLGFNASF